MPWSQKIRFADATTPAGSSSPGADGHEATSSSPDQLFAGSATTEATWRGGPWDGVTMTVVVGEWFFPLYGSTATEGEGEGTTVPTPLPLRGTSARRLCPIRPGPDGDLVIDWAAGTPEP